MTSRARAGTVSHMRKLAATALVTTVACSSKCGSTTTGYAVVDPMPRPARTTNAASSIKASASFAEGGAVVVVELEEPTTLGITFASVDGGKGYSVLGARVVSAARTKTGMRFELEPDPGRGAVYVDLDVDGPDGPGAVRADVAWGTSASGAREIRVTMEDR